MAENDISEKIAEIDGPPLALAPGDVHCWLFTLEREASDGLLDASERARASRFRFDRDRRRFIAGHDAVRRILARYVDMAPHRLEFTIAPGGRPSLATGGVYHNYSRADEWGLLAVSEAAVLGADIEAVRQSDDLAGVAQRFFSPNEQASLNTLTGAIRAEGFFNCWTRKEAVVKALGVGLSAPLQAFDVSLAPSAWPQILRAEGECAAARSWTLRAFKPLDGYCAAVATDIAAPRLQLLREAPQRVSA